MARKSKSHPDLPPYLVSPSWPAGTEPLARLSLQNNGARWLLEGDPQVSLVAKRLFPGAKSLGQGKASFPNNARTMQDLSWFRLRFPIAAGPGDETTLEAACAGAIDHAIGRIDAARNRTAPSGDLFTGEARDYQSECLAFALANKKVLVADDTGMGKTVEALLLLASGASLPALVVVQPHLVTQWEGKAKEFLRTGDGGLRIATIRTRGMSKDDCKRGRDVVPDADVIITHYGLIAYWRERFLEIGFKTVVFDEIGDLRHPSTDKYNAASLVSSSAEYVMALSATPIYNYGDEMWSIMDVVDFQCLGSKDDFTREWCTQQSGRMMVTDPAALGAFLRREGLMIRRLKGTRGVKGKFRDIVRLDADDGVYRKSMKEAVSLLREYRDSDRLRKFTLSGRIGEVTRRATGLAKVDAAVVFLTTLLEAGEPVVVFAYHHDVVDALVAGLHRFSPGCMTGRESTVQKDKAKEDFIAGKSQLLIINLRSATGIDGLQYRARIAVVCELDWSPAIHTQVEDRVWRDGQDLDVLVYYLVSSVGSDPDMEAKLGLKIGQAKGILGDPFETPEQRTRDEEHTRAHVTALIERLSREFSIDRHVHAEAA